MRALVFTSLVLINMGLILVNRSFNSSVLRALCGQIVRCGFCSAACALLAVAVYWPPAEGLFNFGALHWKDLAVCAVAGGFSLLLLEGLKAKWFRGAAGGRCQQRRRVACDLQIFRSVERQHPATWIGGAERILLGAIACTNVQEHAREG